MATAARMQGHTTIRSSYGSDRQLNSLLAPGPPVPISVSDSAVHLAAAIQDRCHSSLASALRRRSRGSHSVSTLSFSFLNCNSLSSHADLVQAYLQPGLDVDAHRRCTTAVFAFSETKVDEREPPHLPNILHYTWMHKPHTTASGGLACLIHDSVAARIVNADHPSLSHLAAVSNIASDATDSSAIMWLELRPTSWHSPILLGTVYLSPHLSALDRTGVLHRLMDSIDSALRLWPSTHPFLLLGDFNLRHEALGEAEQEEPFIPSADAETFVDYLDQRGLAVLNATLLPTDSYTRPQSRSMLDLAICNQSATTILTDMHVGIDGLVSDHEAITVTCTRVPHPVALTHAHAPSHALAPDSDLGQSHVSASIWHPSHLCAPTVPRIDWNLNGMKTEQQWIEYRIALQVQLALNFPFEWMEQLLDARVAIGDMPAHAHAHAPAPESSSAPQLSVITHVHSPLSVIEHANDCLLACLHEAAHTTIGVSVVTERSVDWWSKAGVRDAYHTLLDTHRNWQLSRTGENQQMFRTAQQAWRERKAEAKKEAYSERCATLQSKLKSPLQWSTFRRSCPSNYSSLTSFPHPVTHALPVSLHQSLNHLAAAFVSSAEPPPIPPEIQRETEEHIEDDSPTCPAHIPDPSDLWTFSAEDVMKQCTYQHTNTASGCDSIPALMLKHGGQPFWHALSLIYTYSWRYAVLPQSWRVANVCSMYKGKGHRHVIGSYRPISVTSILIRTMEHLVHHHLADRLEQSDYLHPHQFGFRKGRSTYDALTYLMSHIRSYLRHQRKQPVPVIFLDLRKAFDRVSPDRLLYLLSQRAGVKGAAWNWIRAFLSNRLIRTISQSTCSDWHPIQYGVPQGSVLSPLLFLIFVQEAIHQLHHTPVSRADTHCIHTDECTCPTTLLDAITIQLYADDIALYPRLDQHLPFLIWTRLFQRSLDCLTTWASNNGMEFSYDKSAIVYFGRYRSSTRALRTLHIPFAIGGFELRQSDTYLYLGLLMQRKLDWTAHYEHVLSRVKQDCYLISRLSQPDGPPYFSAIRALCMGYLRPRCTYALSLWRPTKPQLQHLQSYFVRPMLRHLHLSHSTNQLGMCIESDCPSFKRYRQSLIQKHRVRAYQLPLDHPIRQLWNANHEFDMDQPLPRTAAEHHRYPQYTYTFGTEAQGMYANAPDWSTCIGPHACTRIRRVCMQLTHADWLATLPRSLTDPTPLRFLHDRPCTGRSLYLYHDPHRDATIIRARLRMNRGGNSTNADLGHPMAGPGLCTTCSIQQSDAVPDTVQHVLLHCTRYREARHRVTRQLTQLLDDARHHPIPPRHPSAAAAAASDPAHIIAPPPRPPADEIELSLRHILDLPAELNPQSTHPPHPIRCNQWTAWLICTGNYLRSISQIRIRIHLTAL